MTGVSWTVQIVQYPLFALVGAAEFAPFHAAHAARITPVVFGAMRAELLSALALLVVRPAWAPGWLAWAGAACAVATWALTGLVQVPQHTLRRRAAPAAAGGLPVCADRRRHRDRGGQRGTGQ
jgi:hypothetical protein